MNKLPIVLLAGKPSERDELMEYADVDYKALIEFNNKTSIMYVLEAIARSDIATQILIAGIPRDLVSLPDGIDPAIVEFLEIEGKNYEKIYQGGMRLLEITEEKPEIFTGNIKHALYMPTDIPLLRDDIIHRFLDDCGDMDADFYYSVIPEDIAKEKAPDFDWGYMKVRDASLSAGSLVLLNLEALKSKFDLVVFLTENRKSFIKGVFFRSPILFFKLVFGRIKLAEVEKLMTKTFGIESRLVISEDVEIGMDLDRPQDLDYMKSKLESN